MIILGQVSPASLKEAKDAIVAAKAATAQPAAAVATWWTTQSAFSMSLVVLAYGAITLSSVMWACRNRQVDARESRLIMLTMIITTALFLVVAGYSDQQTAPVMGLLGTIVGYILGKPEGKATPPVGN